MDRRDAPPPLKHEVAFLGDEEVVAPVLENRCGGDGLAPEARRISLASRGGLLRCAVCGTAVKKVFGTRRRWHFALLPSAAPCGHENETLQHRESKLALFRALSHSLPGGWGVHLERPLENGRRPDVLAVHEESGARVAFEVQYADLSGSDWRERHEDYAKIRVRDVWMLGHAREGSRRDGLANALTAAEGQRVVYVGRREGEGEVRAREAIFSAGLSRDGLSHAEPGAATPGALVAGWQGLLVAEWVEYGLDAVRLSEDGTLSTPADDAFERLRREAERERRREEERRKAAEGRRRAADERAAEAAAEAEGRRRWAAERRASEARAWKESPERDRARRVLGDKVLALLESEGPLDRNIYRPPGRWKTAFFLSRVHGRPPGTVFDWFKAAGAVLREHPHNGHERGRWAWAALRVFIDQLAREGLVEFDHRDDRGGDRYWRTPLDGAQRRRLAQERAEERRKREQEERREADLAARREAELQEKWARNRMEREERERRELEPVDTRTTRPRPPAASRFDRERLHERQGRIGRWLASTDREEARVELGRHLVNRLEREEDLDRAVLAHPGEWKTWLFREHVHGKAQGSAFDLGKATGEALGRFRATGEASLAAEAVRRFVLLLRDECFLAEPKAGFGGSAEKDRSIYVVVGTAGGWTRRLEDRIRRPRE